jgi:hypothetical protein
MLHKSQQFSFCINLSIYIINALVLQKETKRNMLQYSRAFGLSYKEINYY